MRVSFFCLLRSRSNSSVSKATTRFAHRGGQLRTAGNPDHDIALPHAEVHRLHRGPRLLSEDQTAYSDRPQQIQTLVLPKNLELVSQRYNYP